MRIASALAAGLVLSACEGSTVSEAPRHDVSPRTAILSPEGYGPVRIGMSHDQVVSAFGGRIESGEPPGDARAWRRCHVVASASIPTAAVMIEDDKATRIELWAPGVTTDRGVKVGDPEAAVRAAHPSGLRQVAHGYKDPPAKNLIWYAIPGKSGIRYEISDKGTVTSITGGGPSIEYLDGCQ